jgi:choline dehydrogenase-like flavoprotein
MIIHELPPGNSACELCIVGSGPVGMAMALEFEELGRDVLMLESGGGELDASIAEASRAEIVDPRRHADMSLTVCRALGGTSWTWGGRCVAFDDVDFLDREFVPDAQWPLSCDVVSPWYKIAAKYMLCGDDRFVIPYDRALSDGLTLDFVERWASEPRLILRHREALLRSQRIKISLRSTVTGICLTGDGQTVQSLEVATPGGQRTVRAKQIILATGGVETTRLLLHFQQKYRRHFGGVDGPLGRYYMGHLSGKIASIQFDNPAAFTDLDFKRDTNGIYYRRRFLLNAETQIANRVLNTAFWPDNPPFYDPDHRSGVLSAVFLALAFPPTGRRLLSEAIRLAHTGPRPYKLAAHLRNAILGAPHGAVDIYRILRDRFLSKPRKPGFLVPNRGGRYALHYHAEQVPTPSSRIRLTTEVDAYGVPRAVIDLRYTDKDVDSVMESHRLLDRALRSNKIGHMEFWDSPDKSREKVWETAGDGFHQIGSVRMGKDPVTSVVDSDLKVHGLVNLHVASSAVFPTSGQANSTMLAVAFAMRLAHRLAGSNQYGSK